jgi:hypothetical protein
MVNFAPTFERTKEFFHSAQYDFNDGNISKVLDTKAPKILSTFTALFMGQGFELYP